MAAGAIDSAERDAVTSRCWEALRDAAAAQAKHQAATEPATQSSWTVLRSLLTSGRAHLAARTGGEPERAPGSCGWRRENSGAWGPLGACIGWIDDDNVYLEPAAAFRVVQMAGRDVGDVLAVSEQTLKKRLHEKGHLASIDGTRETLTVRRSIAGSTRSVLHLLRSTLLPEVSDGDEEAE